MSTPEAVDGLVGALKEHFSAPIARAVLTSTLRRAKLDTVPLDAAALPEIVHALERALPMYIADESRRNECVGRLRRLVPKGAEARGTDDPRARPSSRHQSIASTVVRVRTADDVGNVCEVGRDFARRVGFPPVDQTKIATAISELARNILLYAVTGEVRIASIESPRKGVEIVATDEGPGIADVVAVMSEGYRSRTGMGMGLKGAKRLMDSFDLSSEPGVGTTVVARKFVP
jgi:serine/threonine-protein kinase RsbT